MGDTLPAGRRVSLHRVLADRVIIDNQGNFESLLLYDDASTQTAAQPRRRKGAAAQKVPSAGRKSAKLEPSPRRTSVGRPPVTRSASLLGASTSERVATLTNTVRISPSVNAGNQIIGYKIAPADNAKLFEQLGLRSGDLLTHVNGVEVGSISNVLEVYRIINRAEVADFTVVREGAEQSLRIDLEK